MMNDDEYYFHDEWGLVMIIHCSDDLGLTAATL